jgi:hypothetical protein
MSFSVHTVHPMYCIFMKHNIKIISSKNLTHLCNLLWLFMTHILFWAQKIYSMHIAHFTNILLVPVSSLHKYITLKKTKIIAFVSHWLTMISKMQEGRIYAFVMTVRLTFFKAGMPTYDSEYIGHGKCCNLVPCWISILSQHIRIK